MPKIPIHLMKGFRRVRASQLFHCCKCGDPIGPGTKNLFYWRMVARYKWCDSDYVSALNEIGTGIVKTKKDPRWSDYWYAETHKLSVDEQVELLRAHDDVIVKAGRPKGVKKTRLSDIRKLAH